jgi:hypothetical protein
MWFRQVIGDDLIDSDLNDPESRKSQSMVLVEIRNETTLTTLQESTKDQKRMICGMLISSIPIRLLGDEVRQSLQTMVDCLTTTITVTFPVYAIVGIFLDVANLDGIDRVDLENALLEFDNLLRGGCDLDGETELNETPKPDHFYGYESTPIVIGHYFGAWIVIFGGHEDNTHFLNEIAVFYSQTLFGKIQFDKHPAVSGFFIFSPKMLYVHHLGLPINEDGGGENEVDVPKYGLEASCDLMGMLPEIIGQLTKSKLLVDENFHQTDAFMSMNEVGRVKLTNEMILHRLEN